MIQFFSFWKEPVWKDENPLGDMVRFEDDLKRVPLYDAISGHAHTPFIAWEAAGPGDNTKPPYTGLTTKDIVSGSLDAYIQSYAREVRAYGKPVFLVPVGGEMNGNYTYNTSPLMNPTLTYDDFRQAWRRVVGIFREEGVTNAAFVWVPQVSPPNPADWGHDPRWRDFYPGDDWVDWCGGVWFDNGPVEWIDPYYQFAVDHGKPFCLESWGVRHGIYTPEQSVEWLREMFDYFEVHSAIKMILYFYRNASSWDDTLPHATLYNGQVNYAVNVNDSDHRLLTDPRYRQVFRERISTPRYISTITGG